MKRIFIAFAALAAFTAVLPAAAVAQDLYHPMAGADRWTPIRERENWLMERIEFAERSGRIDRFETQSLKREFKAIVALEAEYRENDGRLDPRERQDLEARFDRLSARLHVAEGDHAWRYAPTWGPYAPPPPAPPPVPRAHWVPFSERENWLFERIEFAEHSGRIDRFETQSLKREFKDIQALEREYRGPDGSLDPRAWADLEARFDHLSHRIPVEEGEHAWQYRRTW